MEDLYKQGKIRAIGVSNFKEHHIDELLETCEINLMLIKLNFILAVCKKILEIIVNNAIS